MSLIIRNEESADFHHVEALTRRAFWNVHMPGCSEHLLVHCMRSHADFLPELDFVLELDGRIIGNIMFTRSVLTNDAGQEKAVLTFGPLSVEPAFQRRGFGKKLMEHSLVRAREMGYEAVVIFGNPANYVSMGFESCHKHRVKFGEGVYPSALLVCELVTGALAGHAWSWRESTAYEVDESLLEDFDRQFEPLEKAHRPSQEEFYILSRSRIVED